MKLYNPFNIQETPSLVISMIVLMFVFAIIVRLFIAIAPNAFAGLLVAIIIASALRVLYAIFKGK